LSIYCLENPTQCEKGTQWMSAFAFNASVLIVTAINFIVMAFGGFFFYPRYFGTWCNLCYGCCHCAAFITALSVRFNPYGIFCSYNVESSTFVAYDQFTDDSTYKSDGMMLAGLGFVQIILWVIQCCCCCLPLLYTPVDGKSGKDKDKKKKKSHDKEN